jgi:glycosyltransferase involved in cell wall biosynthesis
MVANRLAPGGSEGMLVRLALQLDPRVVRPVVLCLKDAGPWAERLRARDVPLHAELLAHKFDFRVIGRMRRLIERYRPAVVMAVGNGGDRMFWSALAARGRVPLVVWSHVFPTRGRRSFEWVNRRLFPCVDTFVALGERHREALVEIEGVPAGRVRVIRNGIDAGEFDRPELAPAAREEMLAAFADNLRMARSVAQSRSEADAGRGDVAGARSDTSPPILVGIVGNLRADKRHDLFIEAARRVHAARPAARFVIVGDGPERATVQNLMKQADPAGEYLASLGSREDIATLVQGLDVVCLTSGWQECLSVAMLEAMAAGKAFVAPRIGSLDEALIDGVTGRFFEPYSAEAFAKVLVDLIDHPQARAELGRSAREKVRAEFTEAGMAREFERLIASVCKRG